MGTETEPYSGRISPAVSWRIVRASARSALAAENRFLRKQLAMFRERKVKPHRTNDATRWLMAVVSRLFDWPLDGYPHSVADKRSGRNAARRQ